MQRWISRRSMVAWVWTVLCACVVAQAQTPSSASRRRQSVEDHLCRYIVLQGDEQATMTLAEQMTALHVPAVSLAAIRDGRIDWAQAYGAVSLGAHRRRLTPCLGRRRFRRR